MSNMSRRLDRLEHTAPAPDEPGFLGSPSWWALLGGTLDPNELTEPELRALADAVPDEVPDVIELEIAALGGPTDPTTVIVTTTARADET